MNVTRGLAEYKRVRHPVVTIGNFDGPHLGHLALLRAVVEMADPTRGTPVALTFDPHPMKVLAPGVPLLLLANMEDKLVQLQEAGIEEVLVLPFTDEFACLTPEEFVFRILRDAVGVKDLLVGEQFAFGKGRVGRIADLFRLGAQAGFRVRSVSPVRVDGEIVSSSRIRRLVLAGDVRQAARCLGRPYGLGGPVVSGVQRGQAIGWPTANLYLPAERVIPADGVYATTMVWARRSLDSVSYIGTRPTFGQGERLLEVHLLDERVDLYGEDVHVLFIERLRGDEAFASAEELSAQIEQDVAQARERLKVTSQTAADG